MLVSLLKGEPVLPAAPRHLVHTFLNKSFDFDTLRREHG